MRLLLVLLLGLAACSGDRFETFDLPPLSYADRAPIRLAVSEVRIESRFAAPDRPPQLEAPLPVTPETATLALLRQRLQAAGRVGGVLARVEDASVIEEVVGPFGGPDRASDPAAQRRLRGRVKVRVLEVDDQGRQTGAVTTAVTRTVSLPDDSTRARREAVAYALVRDLVDDLDRSLVENIYQNFAVVPGSPGQHAAPPPALEERPPGSPPQGS